MRGLVALAGFSLISGCGGEPAFDARYDEQAKQVNVIAGDIQEELAHHLNAAANAETALATNH